MIYIIRMGSSNYYKIGYTSHADSSKRLAQLQTACPTRLILIAEIEGEEVTERELHRRFWEYRTDGGEEWFEIPLDKITEIEEDYCGREFNYNQSSIKGLTAFDVRPLRRRQQHDTTTRGEDVSQRAKAVDNPRNQPVFLVDCRK
jgi:hypothetical protein